MRQTPHRVPEAWKRNALRLFLAMGVLWILHYPLRMDRLFRAIPDGVALTSYHRGLAREWRALTRRQDLLSLLQGAGIEEATDWSDDEGVFQTLYWLTGRHTVFGLRTTPEFDRHAMTVYGASAVGWKARPMELLWRLRWIPGLGRLEVTPSGTRYLVFRKSRTMRQLGLVLSLDIFEGVLVGALSRNPDAVRELAFRVRHDAELTPAFGSDPRPWEALPPTPHSLWIPHPTSAWLSPTIGEWRLDVQSLAEPALSILATGSPDLPPDLPLARHAPLRDPGPEVISEAPFAAMSLPAQLLQHLLPDLLPEPDPERDAFLLLSGKPYEGRMLGLALPAVQARIPWPETANAHDEASALVDRVNQWGKLGPVLLRQDPDPRRDTTFLLDSAKASFFLRTADEDCAFLEQAGRTLILGSHLGSHRRQSPDAAPGGTPGFWREKGLTEQPPDVISRIWIDAARAYEEARHAVAIYRMITRIAGSAPSPENDRLPDRLLQGLRAASALGELTLSARMRDQTLQLRLETQPER